MDSVKPIFYRGNPDKPLCPACRLYPEICICASTPRLNNFNKISLLIHVKEYCRLTNTGHLLELCLQNFTLEFYGKPKQPCNPLNLISSLHQNYILHPAASLTLQDISHSGQPVNLIIPDGTWRQSSRMLRSDLKLTNLPRVRLSGCFESAYLLRKERTAGHLSTFEAAALALSELAEQQITSEMLTFFNHFVHKLRQRAGKTL